MTDESRRDAIPSGGAEFRVEIKRNCSISPRQLALLLGATAGTSFGIGVGFAAFGAWPILPFVGLETAALVAAFCCVARHAGDYETIEILQGTLKVEIRDAGTVRGYEFNPQWARLIVLDAGRGAPRVALRSHGRMLEIGRHLAGQARLALAERLQLQLSSHRKG